MRKATTARKRARAMRGKRRAARARYWTAPRVSGLDAFHVVPCPFLSDNGFALFALRDNNGALEYLLEIEQARARTWNECISGGIESATVYEYAYEEHLALQIQDATGPLFARGVHLAPWAPRFGDGRTFVAIDSQHRLVAHSDASAHESEKHVRHLLATALDIADPIAPLDHAPPPQAAPEQSATEWDDEDDDDDD